jgi:hypothetical protein
MFRYIVFVIALFATTLPNTQVFSADSASSDMRPLESCNAIRDATLRSRCFEAATSDHTRQSPTSPNNFDGWRLVRTPGANAEDEVISMMRTGDLLRSDPEFAGLTLHCGQAGPEILIIVVQPFPPRSKPKVTLGDPSNETHFEASVLPSGAALLLPEAVMALANGPWQSQANLAVKIEEGDTIIRGVVPLTGLNTALQVLNANCHSR